MAAERRARATWQGDLKSGSGRVSLESGAATDAPINWKAREEGSERETSPEELIAAAHASCFSMALSNVLAQAGTPATTLDTDATATFDKADGGFRMTRMALHVRGDIAGIDEQGFREAAEQAKENCPVSKALAGNVDITVEAALA